MENNKQHTPIIRAKRLFLAKMQVSDAPQAMKWCGDSEATKFLRFSTYTDVKKLEQWIALQQNSNEFGVFLNDGTLIGSTGCSKNPDGLWELGYVFNREFWNKGYATEAAFAVLAYTAANGVRSFYVCHAKENPHSQRVIEKLGFIYQYDGSYSKLDNSATFVSKNYTLNINMHQMNLDKDPYEKIISRQKTVEMRLNDEKRQDFAVGDFVTLCCAENKIVAKITDIRKYANFSALYAAEDLTKCGYSAQEAQTASAEDMLAYYPAEKQAKYGALAIAIDVLATF